MKKEYPKLSREDQEKYFKISEETECDLDENDKDKIAKIEIIKNGGEVELKNGTKIIHKLNENEIILININGQDVNLKSMLPEGFNMIIKPEYHPGFGEYFFDKENNKYIVAPYILDESDLLTWLHEIGHAWDYLKDSKSYLYDINSTENVAKKERNAWAWALKKIVELRKSGFIDKGLTNSRLLDEAKSSLYGYAEHYLFADFKNHKLLLNKSLKKYKKNK